MPSHFLVADLFFLDKQTKEAGKSGKKVIEEDDDDIDLDPESILERALEKANEEKGIEVPKKKKGSSEAKSGDKSSKSTDKSGKYEWKIDLINCYSENLVNAFDYEQ